MESNETVHFRPLGHRLIKDDLSALISVTQARTTHNKTQRRRVANASTTRAPADTPHGCQKKAAPAESGRTGGCTATMLTHNPTFFRDGRQTHLFIEDNLVEIAAFVEPFKKALQLASGTVSPPLLTSLPTQRCTSA